MLEFLGAIVIIYVLFRFGFLILGIIRSVIVFVVGIIISFRYVFGIIILGIYVINYILHFFNKEIKFGKYYKEIKSKVKKRTSKKISKYTKRKSNQTTSRKDIDENDRDNYVEVIDKKK